jgi:predicted transcriptional regulator with HTH domain
MKKDKGIWSGSEGISLLFLPAAERGTLKGYKLQYKSECSLIYYGSVDKNKVEKMGDSRWTERERDIKSGQ